MNAKRIIAAIVFIDFAALNIWALEASGVDGLLTFLAEMGPWGYVLAADVTIALAMLVVWMVADARAKGRNPIGYALLTLLGSLGPLAYVAMDKSDAKQSVLSGSKNLVTT